MVTFVIALVVLLLGYLLYGRLVDRELFHPDSSRKTPALTKSDGVDYIALPTWKIYMIQFLNIAGLGPIFGAIMGAQFGTASYIWIVAGTIFAGAVHDFLSGAISIRNGGITLPEIIGMQLGERVKRLFGIFTIILMVLVGAVFVSGPAELLDSITPSTFTYQFWIVIIFLYYLFATLLPVDKIIGKVYPLFAIVLLFMAVAIMVSLFVNRPQLPEMWEGFGKKYESNPIFPMMFISIACGAISGFHATQSPLMARCISNERHCRPIFYGAMVTEGVVALIWAAAATWFFQENGVVDQVTGRAYSGAVVAKEISFQCLGAFGGILAMLGIVAAPITSGDTALRSARLMIAEMLHIDQKHTKNRLYITMPLFLVTIAILLWSLGNAEGFKIIWRYFSWSNQTLSVFTLWALTVWLTKERKNVLFTLVPALFMTFTCATYILVAPEGLSLNYTLSYIIGALITILLLIIYIRWSISHKR